MADSRDVDLTIRAKMESDEAAKKAADLHKTIKATGTSAEETAGDLEKVAGALDGVSAAEDGLAAEARETAQALGQAGAVAVESAQEAATAARQQAAAIEGVTSAAGEEAAAQRAAGEAGEKAATDQSAAIQKVIAGLREQFEAIRSGNAPLQEQIVILREWEVELTAIAAGNRSNTDLAKAHTAASTAGLEDVRTHIREVTAALAAQGDTYSGLSADAKSALSAIKAATITVDQATINAARAIQRATEEMENTGRIGPRAIGFAAQAVENYRLTVIAARGSIEAAREEEVATLRELEEQLSRVTARANALTNASKDNAVRLKETGAQIGGIGLAVQDLTRFLGPNAQAFGNVAAQAGIAALNYEQAKDALGGLNINQLGAAKGAAGLAAQVASVIGVFIAAAAAGKALSDTNIENAESWETIGAAIRSVFPTLGELKDRAGAAQSEFAKLFADDSKAEAYFDLLTLGLVKLAGGFARGDDANRAFTIGLTNGRAAASTYYALLNAGFTTLEAEKAATDDARRASEAFTRAKTLGAEGIKLWDAALRASGGSSEKLAQLLPGVTVQLDALAKKHGDAKAQADAHAEAERKLRESLILLGSATEDNAAITQKALEEAERFEQAINGTTISINQLLDAIKVSTEAGDGYSIATARVAAALETVVANTGFASKAERDRVLAVVDLAKRSDELTEAEKKRLPELIKAIESGQKITTVMQEQAAAAGELIAATAAVAGSIDSVTRAENERTASVMSQLDSVRAQIAELERQGAATQSLSEINLDAGMSIDYLRAKEAQLTRELEPQLTVWSASGKAIGDVSAARDEHVTAIRSEITANTDLAAINDHVRKSEDGLREALTNLTPEQRAATDAAVKAAAGVRTVRESADEAATAMRNLQTPFAQIPGDARSLAEALPQVNIHVRALRDLSGEAAENMERLARATRDANAAAQEASQ